MSKLKSPLALIVLDGWGYRAEREGNAIALAATPFYDELCAQYPFTLLDASGVRVGLPPGIMGNSNVGHLNMGAGRVVPTDVRAIDMAIESGEFFTHPVLIEAMDRVKDGDRQLHLMGLVSDGLVHSSLDHLYALLQMAQQRGLCRVFIHCFLDGRDTPPSSALTYLQALQAKTTARNCGQIASVVGRYYAMDRDKRWERTQRAYELLVYGRGEPTIDPIAALPQRYDLGVTDEFIEPMVVTDVTDQPLTTMRDDDSVIFFNFRADRARQLTSALALADFDAFPTPARPKLHFVCFAQYDQTFPLPVVFPRERPRQMLAEVFAAQGVQNYRLAETEKYAHVTYFFNGGIEQPFPGEQRRLIPSPKVATYDLQPEMSAFKLTDQTLRAIDEGTTDVFIINFANPDMVGHTGNLLKAIEAVQHVDTCLSGITKAIKAVGGRCLITADHGNCEQMIDPVTGEPHTAHTTNLVPFHLIDEASKGLKLRAGGALEDVAPTILGLLGLAQPAEMTGRDLRER